MKLTLFHFFPEKLNLYGDTGNVTVLKKRCQWRGINLDVKEIKSIDGINMEDADMLFIGGGSDREQSLCTKELFQVKNEFKKAIEEGVPALTICGGYQFLGTHYITKNGEKLEGLGILDFYSEAKTERLIGNVLLESKLFGKIVGYENHGGRTYHNYDSLGKVVSGFGNNAQDKQEGLLYKNLIGTYLHGPLLPKNPKIADFLIGNAINRKYGKKIEELQDKLEVEAKNTVWERFIKQ